MFDAIGRLLQIAVLTREFEECIVETAHSTGYKEMSNDLKKLEEALESICSFFIEGTNRIGNLAKILEKESYKNHL